MQINDKINYLTLISLSHKTKSGLYGIFKCDCGNEKIIRINAVSSESTKSCGCHRKKQAIINGKNATTHGMTGTPLYKFWLYFIEQYTGHIDENWLNFDNFHQWCNDWVPGLTICRKNHNLPFGPDNCILVNKDEAKQINTKHTNLNKYGVEYPQVLDFVKEQCKKTSLDKYGHENPFQNIEVKNKFKKTCLDKYGVDHPMLLESTKNEIRKTFEDHGIMKTYEGMHTGQWAEKLGISRSWMNYLVRTYGFVEAVQYVKDYSWMENKLIKWLIQNNISYQHQSKIGPYFPDFILENKLIIELDGLYWHSDAVQKNSKYHFNKRIKYQELGYSCCFFREDEITKKFDIVVSIIKNKLKITNDKIQARKCKIYKIGKKSAKTFFDQNHLMGNGRGDTLVLSVDHDIVCALQYYQHGNQIHISRFCNKLNTNVVGGFSRLLSKLPNKEIINFIDLRYGTGEHLYNLGFNKVSEHLSFRWTKDCTTVGRMVYPGKSGYEEKYYRIYDCGQAKFVKPIIQEIN